MLPLQYSVFELLCCANRFPKYMLNISLNLLSFMKALVSLTLLFLFQLIWFSYLQSPVFWDIFPAVHYHNFKIFSKYARSLALWHFHVYLYSLFIFFIFLFFYFLVFHLRHFKAKEIDKFFTFYKLFLKQTIRATYWKRNFWFFCYHDIPPIKLCL